MPARRKYTARTRARAVGIAVVDGVTAAGRATGIPKTTIQQWIDLPEYVHLRTTTREKVLEQMWIGIQVGIRELTAGLSGDAMLHHKADALRTLTDRYALLAGEATSRTENRELHDSPDHELREGVREAERILAGDPGGAPPPPEDPPAG